MPYWGPVVQPMAGQYTVAAGEAVAESIKRYQEMKKQEAFSDATMEHLSQVKKPDGTPYVPIDALTRYRESNMKQKAGIAQAAMANAAFDQAAINATSENAVRSATAAHLQAETGQVAPLAASEITLRGKQGALYEAQTKAQGQDEGAQYVQMKGPDGKPLPMWYIPKTGAVHSIPGEDDPTAQPRISDDGKFYYKKDKSGAGSWQPVPAPTLVLPGMPGYGTQGQPAAPGGAQQPGAGGQRPQVPGASAKGDKVSRAVEAYNWAANVQPGQPNYEAREAVRAQARKVMMENGLTPSDETPAIGDSGPPAAQPPY